MPITQLRRWWKEATCYQIWPASFQDSNGDGLGDIQGIISRLDYLKDLGVDLIWLSPIYDSPQHDMGYDVRNYEDIYEKYGNLKDMEALIAQIKSRGMKLIMDLVVNHTSFEHHWFLESRKSRNNPYSDWYIWRDPKYRDADGTPHPPCNWRAAFGGSVWTYAPEREQYYLHLALPEQPDLNWQNEITRKAIYKSAIEFWLAKGIDGFRVDVVNFYWKDLSFPDSKVVLPDEEFQPMEVQHVINGPRMHEWLQEQRSTSLDKFGEDIILVGELPGTSTEEVLRYIDPQTRELDMIFDFDIFVAGNNFDMLLHEFRRAKLTEIKKTLVKTQGFLNGGKAWTTTFLENHDVSRSVSRFGPGDGPYHTSAAKMLALLVATLSGTLFIYQGQEIGMSGLPSKKWKREDFKDRAAIDYLDKMERQYGGDEAMMLRAFEAAVELGRDNARTPMQWTAGANAGFSNVDPWIPVNDNYVLFNAEDQAKDPGSILGFWKQFLKLRKLHKDTLIYGSFSLVDAENEKTLTFLKSSEDGSGQCLVALNFSDQETELFVPESMSGAKLNMLVSTSSQAGREGFLDPWEGRLYGIESNSPQ